MGQKDYTLEDIAEIIDDEKPPPQDTNNKMILLGLKHLDRKFGRRMDDYSVEVSEMKKNLENDIGELKDKVEENPAFKFGELVKDYKWINRLFVWAIRIITVLLFIILVILIYIDPANLPAWFWEFVKP